MGGIDLLKKKVRVLDPDLAVASGDRGVRDMSIAIRTLKMGASDCIASRSTWTRVCIAVERAWRSAT